MLCEVHFLNLGKVLIPILGLVCRCGLDVGLGLKFCLGRFGQFILGVGLMIDTVLELNNEHNI